MTNDYINKEALLEYLDTLSLDGDGKIRRDALLEAVQMYIEGVEKKTVIHCRDCSTFNQTGIEEGYGWCKKFCFGPPVDFYCQMATPIEAEPEIAAQDAGGEEA